MSNPADTRASLNSCRHGILAGFCVTCRMEETIAETIAAQQPEIERLTQRVAELERNRDTVVSHLKGVRVEQPIDWVDDRHNAFIDFVCKTLGDK